MKVITLYNNFHGTSVVVHSTTGDWLTANQVRRAKRELCGQKDCMCSGEAGQRGSQDVEIEVVRDSITNKLAGAWIYHGDFRAQE